LILERYRHRENPVSRDTWFEPGRLPEESYPPAEKLETETLVMKSSYLILVAGAALGTFVVSAFAQNPSSVPSPADSDSETVVVTASKIPQKLASVGSAITALPGTDLERSQIRRIQDALILAPGTAIVPNGQSGAISSLLLRGTNPNQTQVVVDGVRISDANISADVFLGGEFSGLLQQVEVLRGPQSALYGGEAIGGVVNILSPRGRGTPVTTVNALTGSFDTFGSQLSSSGEVGQLGYSLFTGWGLTANDRPHNDFSNFQYATRLDVPLSEFTSVGLTFRGAERSYQSPGSIYENDLDNIEEEEFLLTTAFIDHKLSERWNTRFLTAWMEQDLGFIAPPFPESIIDHRKLTLDWRNTINWNDSLVTLIGANYESRGMDNTGYGVVSETDSLISAYIEQTLTVAERLSLTGGGRWEHYSSFGEAITWRGTAAYNFPETGTTLRASAGTGFRAPSFFELYAMDSVFQGNPNLTPEESFGWDAGVSQEIGKVGTLALTWFENDLTDLIVTDFTTAPLSVINLEGATTSGVEAEFSGAFAETVHYRLAYTYLQAEDASTGETLIRRPKHTLGFDVNTMIGDRLTLGLGGQLVEDRLDVDAVTYLTIPGDSYFIGRVYGAFQVNDNIQTHLSVENVADEEYDVIAGFSGARARRVWRGEDQLLNGARTLLSADRTPP